MRSAVLAVLLAAALAACADPIDDGDVTVTDDTSAPTLDDKADANSLTTAQQKAALFQLNQICGDTWCDGDWNFEFKKIVCHWSAGTCTTTALIWPYTDAHPVPVYWRSCKIAGLHHFTDLVDTAANGYQSIDQGFYDKMTTCTMKIAAKLPSP